MSVRPTTTMHQCIDKINIHEFPHINKRKVSLYSRNAHYSYILMSIAGISTGFAVNCFNSVDETQIYRVCYSIWWVGSPGSDATRSVLYTYLLRQSRRDDRCALHRRVSSMSAMHLCRKFYVINVSTSRRLQLLLHSLHSLSTYFGSLFLGLLYFTLYYDVS